VPDIRDLIASARPGATLPPTFVKDMARIAWDTAGMDRLIADIMPILAPQATRRTKRKRATRPRWFDLAVAVKAAKVLLGDHQLPTFELIHEQIATTDEPGLPIDTLRSRWRLRGRDEPPITMDEVLDEARR
jgi:hypothetical protein